MCGWIFLRKSKTYPLVSFLLRPIYFFQGMFILLYPKRVPKYLPFPCLSCFVFFCPLSVSPPCALFCCPFCLCCSAVLACAQLGQGGNSRKGRKGRRKGGKCCGVESGGPRLESCGSGSLQSSLKQPQQQQQRHKEEEEEEERRRLEESTLA